jgi:hypothetical protein
MAKYTERIKARALRRTGESIIKIAKTLLVSKSTVSMWCNDIVLTEQQQQKLVTTSLRGSAKGRMMGAETNKKKKMEVIARYKQEGLKFVGRLSTRDLTIIALSLYWSEGSKTRGAFSFVNSDPFMIKCIYKWLQDSVGLKDDDFIPRVAINEMHRTRINKVLRYWSNLLKLPRRQFRATFFIKNIQKKTYDNYETYFGTLVLRVRKSTNLKYKILGLIEGVKEHLSG